MPLIPPQHSARRGGEEFKVNLRVSIRVVTWRKCDLRDPDFILLPKTGRYFQVTVNIKYILDAAN